MLLALLLIALAPVASPTAVVWEPRHAESFERGAHPTVRAACGEIVDAVARALRLDDVTSCDVDVYAPVGGPSSERLRIVTLGHGPMTDCEAGCVQDHSSAIVRGSSIVAVPETLVHLQSPGVYVREFLLATLPERGVRVAEPSREGGAAQTFDFFMADGFCANRHDLVHIVTDGKDVYWRLAIPLTECAPRVAGTPWTSPASYRITLQGELRLPIAGARGTYPKPDGSRLDVRVSEHP